MMMDTHAARTALEEWDTHEWWVSLFCESGYERPQAEKLLEAGVNWHEADALLRDGCPSVLAVQILT